MFDPPYLWSQGLQKKEIVILCFWEIHRVDVPKKRISAEKKDEIWKLSLFLIFAGLFVYITFVWFFMLSLCSKNIDVLYFERFIMSRCLKKSDRRRGGVEDFRICEASLIVWMLCFLFFGYVMPRFSNYACFSGCGGEEKYIVINYKICLITI